MNIRNMPLKAIALLGVLAFGVTLAIIIGQRLSTEAMAVLMGVVAGVVASIPTSLIVVWIALQSMLPQYLARAEPRGAPAQPEPARVVVVQQPQPAPSQTPAYALPGWGPQPYPAMAPSTVRLPRKFTVIGGANDPEDLSTLPSLELDR